MASRDDDREKMAHFLGDLTELSRRYGLGIALGVEGQPATLFILERDECDDFNRIYRVDDEGRLFFD